MWTSLIIILCFIGGILCGRLDIAPEIMAENETALCALWVLMACVGLSVGADKNIGSVFHILKPQVLLLPLATTLGTFSGAVAISIFLPYDIFTCLAIGSGFAYYSLSSIFITQFKGPDVGAVALAANISRELFTLVMTPLLVKFFSAPAAISCGGATTMDTTLPIILQYGGNKWMMPAIAHALILDFSVPFWVTLFCAL